MTNHCDFGPEALRKFDVFDWRNGCAILKTVHPSEWNEVATVLSEFELRHSQLVEKGRNKTETAKILDSALRQKGWKPRAFDTRIVVDNESLPSPTHEIDCFKNKVALEVEWNNKDPFFDRDLNNFRLLYELRVIDLGIVITRSTELQKWLHENRVLLERDSGTYGGSTTHFEKLRPKIVGGGAGGCPVIAFSIRREAYIDDRQPG